MPSWDGRKLCLRLRLWETADWGRFRLGGSLVGRLKLASLQVASHDGFVYSQVSVMPSNAGGSTAYVVGNFRVYDHQAV